MRCIEHEKKKRNFLLSSMLQWTFHQSIWRFQESMVTPTSPWHVAGGNSLEMKLGLDHIFVFISVDSHV